MSKSTNIDGNAIYAGKSKSLYTAVLCDNTPESSTSSSGETRVCTTYLKQLTREHLARANMEEVESSVAGSPSPESKERVALLTERVKRAYSEARGNPADGRWSFVSDLLRLNTTRGGRHWLGTNTDIKALEVPQHLCVIPKTSEEWHELERKRKEEEDVKSKVQRWITTAEFKPLSPETTLIQETNVNDEPPCQLGPTGQPSDCGRRKLMSQASLKAISDPKSSLSRASKLGFTVVKRSSTIVADKPTAGRPRLQPSPPPAPPVASDEAAESPNSKDDIATGTKSAPCGSQRELPIMIADDSNNNFLPPSFSSSQIQTSTPLPERNGGVQKSTSTPIKLQPLPTISPPLATKSHPGNQNDTSSPPPAPQIPEPSSCQVSDDVGGNTRKRSRSRSTEGEPVAKRVRKVVQDAEVDQSPITPPAPVNPTPVTPLLKDLPRLTELLASARRSTHRTPKKRRASRAHAGHSDDHHGSPSHVSVASKTKEAAVATVSPNKPKPTSPTPVPEPVPQYAEAEAEVIAATANRVEGSPSAIPEPLSKDPPPEALHASLSEDPSLADLLPVKSTPAEAPPAASPISGTESQPAEAESVIEEVLAVPESRPQTPVRQKSPDSDPFRFPSPDPGSFSSKLGVTAYNLYGLDAFDHSSPAKSLSSLAGSDSESDDDEDAADAEDERRVDQNLIPKDVNLLDAEFAPQFTSTQKPDNSLDVNLASGITLDGLGWANGKLPSTSQLQAEVNSQVNEFDKFMEADLSCDVVALSSSSLELLDHSSDI